jgi:hypothetical protein
MITIEEEKCEFRSAEDFDDSYGMVTIDFEIRDILDFTDVPKDQVGNYTGLFVLVADGEYIEIWGTEDTKPYDNQASYEKLK